MTGAELVHILESVLRRECRRVGRLLRKVFP